MPKAVSKKQYRMMIAIAHGGPKNGRQPPKSVAAKYTKPEDGATESKNNDRGGMWNAHEKGGSKSSKEKDEKKKDKKKLKKAFSEYYSGKGAGVIVLNEYDEILVGTNASGETVIPGGHLELGEDYLDAAGRTVRDETDIVINNINSVGLFKSMSNENELFICNSWAGEPKDTNKLSNVRFVSSNKLADENLSKSSKAALDTYLKSNLKKNSLQNMLAIEVLAKNVMRGGVKSDVVFDVSHGDALRLVGNGCFRFLKRAVADMEDEDFREFKLDDKTISLRRHMTDVYSGRITDGHKVIHQFTNKSLPALCADIMSVFEWYHNEDEHVFDILDEESLSDDAIFGGLNQLTENYKKENLANIYTEMENIREEIRHGQAVDLQQVEEKMMKLFDKLEATTHKVVEAHNKLNEDAGNEITDLENKLKQLANKVDELSKKPESIEAYQTKPVNANKVYDAHYMYLPRPEICVQPNGKITISFNKDWTDMEKSNFLSDMKAKIVKRD